MQLVGARAVPAQRGIALLHGLVGQATGCRPDALVDAVS